MVKSANEVISDLITEHAIDLSRVEAGFRNQIREFLRDLEKELVSEIADIDPTGVERTTYRQQRLEKLLKQVQETIRISYRDQQKQLFGSLRTLADLEMEFAARAINTGLQFGMATVELTNPFIAELVKGVLVQGAPVSEWWSRQAGDTLERFTDQMRIGIAQGETSAELIRRVRGGRQNGADVIGLMQTSRTHADSLVRAATRAVAEAGRQEIYRQNSNLLRGLMWTATLDTRTTLVCAARDNRLYDVNTLKPIGHDLEWGGGPGNLHWGCRSSSTPVTKNWRELGIDEDDLPPGGRASIDGEVPDDTTFEAWLARQPVERQEAVLGPGRADLWREGKLTFRDLLDGNGREMTLEQLRAKVRS